MISLTLVTQENNEIININSDNEQQLKSIDAIECDAIYYNIPEIFFDKRLSGISKESELMNKLIYMFFDDVRTKEGDMSSISYSFTNLGNGIESVLADIDNDKTLSEIVNNINKYTNIDARYERGNIVRKQYQILLKDDESGEQPLVMDIEIPSGTIDCITEEDLNKMREE